MRNRLSTVIAQVIALIAVLALSLGWGADVLSAQEYSYASQVLIDQPLAYWRLGETSGTSAVNIGGLGSAVDGTYTNGVTLGEPGLVPGEIDSAARFDGSNDLVDIPGHPAINEGGPYVEKTIELWFEADDVSGRQMLYEEGGSNRGLNVYLDDDALYANIYNIYSDDPSEPLWGPVYISTTISAGSTYHAALRVTGGYTSTGAIQGYLNGALFGAADGVGFLYAHDDPIGIGGENGETYYHDGAGASGEAGFSGVIDEVALYDYALSANRIRVHAVRAMDISKQADPPGAVAPGDTLTYSVAITTSTIASDLTISDTLPGGTSYVANSGYVTTTNPFVRATEYYIASGQFTTTTYSLQLMYDLAPDYLAIIQGSDGSAVYDSRTYLGPDKNYAALVADPFGTGDLAASPDSRTLQLQRGGVISGTDQGWVGVVTVVESLEDQEGSGFELLDVLQVTHTGVLTSGTDSSTSWGDIDQVMLLGGYNGAGCSTVVTSSFDNKVCHARIWPSGSDTVNWTRDAVSVTLDTATSTVMVVEWGTDWTVQRVRVQGSNGGDGADEVGEYNTEFLGVSVARANTWVWGTGHTKGWGIGAAAEGVLITLGNGVTQNATESQVAVSLEEAEENAVDFEVYALTHPQLQVDYRFKEDGNDYDLVVPVPVDAAGGNRFALVYNGQNGTGEGYPRPMLSARYVADDVVLLGHRLAEQAWPAWVQGIDLSGLSEESTQNGNPSTLLGSTYTLGAGQTMALTYRVSLDTPWSGGSVITNTVAITSAEMSSPATSIVTNTVTTSSPLITVTKQGPATAQVGDVVTYTFTVAHAPGSDGSPVESIALVDDVAGPATLVSGDDGGNGLLEDGETWVYTTTYTIQASDASPLTNTGTVTGEDGDGDLVTASASHSLDIDYAPALTITKQGPATAQVGDVVAYTFTVAHAPGGDGSPVASVALVDDVADPTTLVSGDDGGNGLLEDGETWVYTTTYTIQASDASPLTNTGTVTGLDGDGVVVTASASHSLDIGYAPALTITKQGPSTAQVGDVVLYVFTVAHAPGSDGSPVADVALVDDVAGPATLVSGDDGDDLLEGTETWVYNALHTVLLTDADPLANTGTLTGEDGDGDAVTVSASHSLDIEYAPVLTITKQGPATAQVGDVVTYTFTVAHAPGSDGSPVASVALVDDLAGPATLVSGDDGNGLLENGETWIYTATYTIQASDASPLTNTGTVTGLDGDGDVVTASASHSVDIGYAPALTITKQGPATAQVGDVVTYTFTVAHAPGSDGSPVASVALVDDLAGPATLVSGDDGNGLLENGETWIYTATYTIQEGDPEPLVNTGTVTGVDGDGDAVTASDSHSLARAYVLFMPYVARGFSGPN